MTLLTIAQSILGELDLGSPTAVYTSTDKTIKQLLRHINRAGQLIAKVTAWEALNREHTFSTAASTDSYDLPSDFDRLLPATEYNRGDILPLMGPLSPSDWQYEKSGSASLLTGKGFRVKGGRFFVTPTPTAVQTFAFEYITNRWCISKQWVTGTAYSANESVSNRFIRYTASAAGTSGATAPTHTTGSASDGSVTWTFQDAGYQSFAADTDLVKLPEFLVELEAKWRFLRSKGMSYDEEQAEAQREIAKYAGREAGRDIIIMGGNEDVGVPFAVTKHGNWNL